MSLLIDLRILLTKILQTLVVNMLANGVASRVANMINQKYNDIVYDANNGMNSWIKSNLRVIKP